MTSADYAGALNTHYARNDLADALLEGVRAAGKDPDALTPLDLAPVDQFHTGGRDATLELARMAELRPGMRVLDVGGGLGGPARTLASEFGCTVTVLDLTEEFCRVGEWLTAMTDLADRVTFRHGSALDMPFDDASFDVAWTQHSSMNIEDKERLYTEIRRVLRSGGRLALHEVMVGPVQPVHFPAPWASDSSISFLRPPEEIRSLLSGLGFREIAWVDMTDRALEFMRRLRAATQPGAAPPALGLHLIMPNAAERFANQTRNVEEDRVRIVEAVFDRA